MSDGCCGRQLATLGSEVHRPSEPKSWRSSRCDYVRPGRTARSPNQRTENTLQPTKMGSQARRTHSTGFRRRHHAPEAVNRPYQAHAIEMNAHPNRPKRPDELVAAHHVGRLQTPTRESSTKLLANPTRIHRPELGLPTDSGRGKCAAKVKVCRHRANKLSGRCSAESRGGMGGSVMTVMVPASDCGP